MNRLLYLSLILPILFLVGAPLPGYGTSYTQLTSRPTAEDIAPAWSPDGATIAFTSDSLGWSIWTIPASGGSATYLFPGAYPCWSPDGSKIAFASGGEIWVTPATGGTATQLTFLMPARKQDYPAWSPDGSTIAFSSEDEGPYYHGAVQIWKVPASGGTAICLVYQISWRPSWSPDGSHIAFNSGGLGIGVCHIGVARSDGSDAVEVTSGPFYDSTPGWSPDGHWIAFGSSARPSKGADCDIWLVSPSGGVPIQVTEGAAYTCAGRPTWSPDSRSIAFCANWTGNYEIWLASDLPGTPTSVAETTWGRIKALFR